MRIRSALLVACMVIVPMIAMFSHRVPASVRSAIRDAVWGRLVSAVTPAPAVGQTAVDRPPAASETLLTTAANPAPPGLDSSTVTAAAVPVAVPADAAYRNAEARLAALGAMAIECHPMPGVEGHHAASCRVAIDATGQLHRLFQTSGNGPVDALCGLLADVSAWRQRLASRTGTTEQPPVGVPHPARTMNF